MNRLRRVLLTIGHDRLVTRISEIADKKTANIEVCLYLHCKVPFNAKYLKGLQGFKNHVKIKKIKPKNTKMESRKT